MAKLAIRNKIWVIQHSNLPTFYVDPRIQGVLTKTHAAVVATRITGQEIPVSSVHLTDRDD